MADKVLNEINETTRDELVAFERSKRFRFQEQCFLNYHKARIYAELKTKRPSRRPLLHGGRDSLGQGQTAAGHNQYADSVYDYNHISTLHAKKPARLVSMFNQKSGAETFFRLDSSILTQLKPIVELYKVYPSRTTIVPGQDGAPPSRAEESPRYRVRMPVGESIKVDEEGMPSRQNISSLESLLYNERVLGNAMLTDLNFKFAGQDIALLNTVEDVSFTMSFSSFNMFSHVFKTTVRDSKGQNEQAKEWSYQDLISYSTLHLPQNERAVQPIDEPRQISCFETAERYVGVQQEVEELANTYNPNYFEIQMIVRYDPNDIDWDMVQLAGINTNGRLTLNQEEQKNLKSFLRNSAIALRLQFVGHTIRYGSNSSGADPELVIDFEYKAFIESALNTPELDLLKLPASDTESIHLWEERLKQARELLFAVVEEKKGLSSIFGDKGQVGTNLNTNYSRLRGALDDAFARNTANNTLQWLIFSPVAGSRNIRNSDQSAASRFGLIPTQVQIAKAERGQGNKVARSVHDGLQYDPENLQTALASTENAKAVFQELVDHLARYIKMLKRTKIQEKYESFFKALYAQERVYAVQVTTRELETQLGFEKEGGEETPASELARQRALAPGGSESLSEIAPGAVSIVPSNIVWDDETRRSQPNQSNVNKSLEALNAEFQNINLKTIDNSVAERARTTAQQVQQALGSDRMGDMTTLGNDSLVFFTNLGDIIDTAIAVATYPEHGLFQRRLGILLGPMLEEDRSRTLSNQKYIFNLAYVPVSLKAVMAFFLNNVLASGRERYLLNDFIEELIEQLILPALGSRCIESAQEGNQQVGTVTFTSEMREGVSGYGWTGPKPNIPPFYPDSTNSSTSAYPPNGASAYLIDGSRAAAGPVNRNGGTITHFLIPWKEEGSIRGLTEVSPNVPIEKQFNYMFIYVNNISPIRLDPKQEQKNINNGIYYLHLGQIPSIVKASNFRKENIPYMREARAMGQLTRTGGVSLRDVYHFNCTMYGNNIFKPGMLFYVDPTKDGSSNFDDWRRLGLVGFFRVISVDHQVYTGNSVMHETSVSATWETFGSCEEGDDGLIDTELLDIFAYNRDLNWFG
jgi:hypothetical protein